ncbi:exodeoxyribonuclease VII large subunit [Paenibacillus sp. NPDC056579]|uniref:exodeoxyribonuclease VII large subunit n=1 Tax=Paenibacillus sp. NPDC056579 TaxID=3345871 RepID=UPI0036AB5981
MSRNVETKTYSLLEINRKLVDLTKKNMGDELGKLQIELEAVVVKVHDRAYKGLKYVHCEENGVRLQLIVDEELARNIKKYSVYRFTGYFQIGSKLQNIVNFRVKSAELTESREHRFNVLKTKYYREKNSLLHLTSAFNYKIAIVTSKTSEGLSDVKGLLEKAERITIDVIDVNLIDPESIAGGINSAIAKNYDIILLIRGGGDNFEPFNSEVVCQSIYRSKIPVITGIGHENDKTIADEIADVASSTPTDAANKLLTVIGQANDISSMSLKKILLNERGSTTIGAMLIMFLIMAILIIILFYFHLIDIPKRHDQ